MKIIDRIKFYSVFIVTFVIGLLTFLLNRQKRKTENLESELAREKANTGIKLNEQARQAAKSHADNLVAEYERSLRDNGDKT